MDPWWDDPIPQAEIQDTSPAGTRHREQWTPPGNSPSRVRSDARCPGRHRGQFAEGTRQRAGLAHKEAGASRVSSLTRMPGRCCPLELESLAEQQAPRGGATRPWQAMQSGPPWGKLRPREGRGSLSCKLGTQAPQKCSLQSKGI